MHQNALITMPDLEGISQPQFLTLAIFTSGLILSWLFFHWIHCNEMKKRHKMHEWIPFGLASNMAWWTMFYPMPRICNYKLFCILGPLAHVQLTRDIKMHANKLKMTRFHHQITYFMLHLTQVPFDIFSTLIHTNSNLFGKC